MSAYIDSFILFVLGICLYPKDKLDSFSISCICLVFTVYCFCIIFRKRRISYILEITALFAAIIKPELSFFLPLFCYILFYEQHYYYPLPYLIPAFSMLWEMKLYDILLYIGLSTLSFYLAHQTIKRDSLQRSLYELQDTTTEKQMLYRERNRQLTMRQNDEIYIATLKERNRIAREIHDNVGHLLSRSIMQVGALLTIAKDETIESALISLKETLDTAMNNIRSSVHDLHDESIDLEASLNGLSDGFSFCPVSMKIDISKNIPKNVKYCFLSIVKEAMNNTMKHSNATLLTITVREHPAFYQLLIEDNGDLHRASAYAYNSTNTSPGIGLSNMKERVDSLSGIIHISTDHGFRIFISIPK